MMVSSSMKTMDVHIAERLSQCLRDAGADAQRRGENKISDSFFRSDDVSIALSRQKLPANFFEGHSMFCSLLDYSAA